MAQFEYIQWLTDWLFSIAIFEFVWDTGNETKNQEKHGISIHEAEQVFQNRECFLPLGIQIFPQSDEPRFGALGATYLGKLLSVSFTIRSGKVRIISIRAMSTKERRIYATIRKE